ncbi:sigma-54-dependent Fis family transcriptional regulator [Solidesulfovibrio magneticus]|uniref:Fis family transcriptional regulator n=1 Tax=Solidesulfovibrio magneticus (strain ATCC 700980 / DSM 13731 / RS-1) TaxID=573370 RepID=C4XUC0_SOLM1|nr:sigma-54-dependent Fis family transcriptional regulator [Solidesulfovibrio magneticus]BAH76142.1 fis family transcriptional regulator [Solidesulfovibrio magneticus RS-1]
MASKTLNLQLHCLQAISGIIDQALDLEQSLQDILRILAETLSMKRATITLVDRSTGKLVISVSQGLSPEEKRRGVYGLSEGVTGLIFQTAEPYVVPDIRHEPLFLNKTQSRKIERDRISFVGVPIILHGQPIGVLNVDRLFGDEVDYNEDVAFLTVVATLIGQFMSLNEKYEAKVEVLKRENVSLKFKLSQESRGLYIVGRSLAMQDVQRQIEKVAPTRATVLLLGESGTGKTLIGRIIHDLSERKDYPFIKVNCASIPENLLESELFGYEKGAFTGADQTKPGRFEEANKGTIFLDEIGELPLGLQAKLLRVLQDKEFERLGSNKTRQVDVRILAATNKDLAALAEVGSFRPDLYYRLNVFPLQTPPLRERKEDIQSLIIHFLNKVSKEYARNLTFSTEALAVLKEYDWPGNVREMENLVERLVILAENERIDADLIRPYLTIPSRDDSYEAEYGGEGEGAPSLKSLEKSVIIDALRRHGGIQHKAARELGITPRQMGYRVKKFNLESMVAVQRVKNR